ncbi:MAG: extracellular solute-binding protein [Phycisphaerae bacterium]|nr:extracellular solute-binding protein [Phycisphaerae bacterium]
MTNHRSNLLVSLLTLLAIGLLLGVPFVLRPHSARVDYFEELVIVSPHDESAKIEFARAFSAWHYKHFGQPVKFVWPAIGGSGDITRYVESNFAPQFRRVIGDTRNADIYWREVDRPGSTATQPSKMTMKARSLRDASIGIDLLFGGGEYDHDTFKKKGFTVPYDVPTTNPDFPDEPSYLTIVPAQLNGQPLYDPDHYWYGAVLTRLGIISNRIVCRKLNLVPPETWADLAQPCFRDQLALADPNFSGSAKLCYEMVLQEKGWEAGWRILTNIAANGRYFASGSTQVALDVSRCEAAAGMMIDYYGRTQVDYIGRDPTTGEFRLQYVSPTGATATTPDPISILRGAPNRKVAERFVQFVLSVEGQKLWMCKVGTPGGPEKFGLYRPPIRPDVYENFRDQMIVQEDPFTEKVALKVSGRVRDARFGLIGPLMRAAFIDNSDLLKPAADRARSAAPDSPARREFDALPFPEGDINASYDQKVNGPPVTMWQWAKAYGAAKLETDKETIAADLTALFREKYQRVLKASQ